MNASSDPFAPGETLSLNYLGPSYPSGIAASTSDRIDEANDDRSGDAQRMHAMPKYANRIYGRSVPLQDGGTLLQYWFFYYNNPKTFVTIGDHEGDWEMIQVRLSAEGLATEAPTPSMSKANAVAGSPSSAQRVDARSSMSPTNRMRATSGPATI